jgi:hypothetical protein
MQSNAINFSRAHELIKTVRGTVKFLENELPLSALEKESLQNMGVDPESLRLYEIARRYVGSPYGPVFPKRNSEIYHTDCVDLLWQYLFDAYQISLRKNKHGKKFDSNDQIYFYLTQPVAILRYDDNLVQIRNKLSEIRPGHIAFHGHDSALGVGGVSILHAFIIGKPIFDQSGKLEDYTIINPSGSYSKNRHTYSGQVIEGGRQDIPPALQGLSLLQTLADASLWRKNGQPYRQQIYIGRPIPKN